MWLPSSIIINTTGPFTSRASRSASLAGTMRSSRPFTMKIGQVIFCAMPSSDSVAAFLRASSSVLQWLRTRNASRVNCGRPSQAVPKSNGPPQLTREAFLVRSHCKTDEEARKNAATLSLEGIAQNITCPIFIVNGRLDRIVPAKDAERLAREVKGPVVLMMIEDGNHIATNRAYRWRPQSADWMQEQLK